MTRRTDDDAPATVPTVVSPPERPDNEHWRRWSEDDERRQQHDAMIQRAAAERPIHPRELAQRIAVEMHDAAPDWRLYRPQLGLYWGQLLRAQPECEPRLTVNDVDRRRIDLSALLLRGVTPALANRRKARNRARFALSRCET